MGHRTLYIYTCLCTHTHTHTHSHTHTQTQVTLRDKWGKTPLDLARTQMLDESEGSHQVYDYLYRVTRRAQQDQQQCGARAVGAGDSSPCSGGDCSGSPTGTDTEQTVCCAAHSCNAGVGARQSEGGITGGACAGTGGGDSVDAASSCGERSLSVATCFVGG